MGFSWANPDSPTPELLFSFLQVIALARDDVIRKYCSTFLIVKKKKKKKVMNTMEY